MLPTDRSAAGSGRRPDVFACSPPVALPALVCAALLVVSGCAPDQEGPGSESAGAGAGATATVATPAGSGADDASRSAAAPTPEIAGSPYTLDTLEHTVARLRGAPIRNAAPTEPSALAAWQQTARGRLASSIGVARLPVDRFPLEFETIDQTALQGVVRSDVSWFAEPGFRTRAWLFVPEGDGPWPGIVFWHGHSFDGRDASAGLTESGDTEQHHAGARELARRGYVVLAPTVRTFEPGAEPTDHYYLQALATMRGASALGIYVTDALRALDVLTSLPEVDADRIGVTGLSLGGYLTLLSAALDPRVDAAVVQGFLASYRRSLLTEQQCGCQYGGALGVEFDVRDVAAMAAPTPIRFVAGRADRDVPFADQEQTFDELRPFWPVFDGLSFVPHDGGHEWMLEPAVDWFAMQLADD